MQADERPAKRQRHSEHTVQEMQTILAQSWAAKSPRSLFASRSHMRRRKSEEEPFEIVPTASLLAPLQCTYTEYVDENEVENLDGSDMEMSEDDARPSTSHTHLSLTAISDMMSPSNSAPEIETPRSYSPIPGKEDDFDYLRAIAAEMNLPFPESRFQDPPKLSYRVPLPFEDKLACSWTIVDELEEVPGPYVGVHWRLGISALNEEDNGAEDIQVSDEVMQLATAARDEKFEPEDLWDNLQDYQDGSSPLSSAYSEDEAILADLGEDGVKDSTATSVYSSASEDKGPMKQTTLRVKPDSPPKKTLRVLSHSSKPAKSLVIKLPFPLPPPQPLDRPQTRQNKRNLFVMQAGAVDLRPVFGKERQDSD